MNKSRERPNRPALSLHVPEPPARPGDEVDFSHIEIPAAGSVRRPDAAAPAAETHELVYSLVRVLDDEGKAVGPWDPKLDPDTLRRILREIGRASCRERESVRVAAARLRRKSTEI